MPGTVLQRMHVLFGLILAALIVPAWATLSEPDHLLYGQVSWLGEPVTQGELTLHVPAWSAGPIARYRMGTDPALGTSYALRIPMNSTGSRIPGTARDGDDALIYLDNELVAMIKVGQRGAARRVDLDPANLQGLVALSVNDIEVAEGAAGTTTEAVFTVTLAQPVQDPISFSWATDEATGSDAAVGGFDCDPGIDFISNFGSGVINPGDLETQFSVTVCGNDLEDGNRRFLVQLSDPSDGVGLLKPVGEATILDNDTLPMLSIEDVTVTEPPVGSTRQAVFRVSLSSEWHSPVSVQWTTANGTATAGIDYVADSGTLLFAAGQVSRQIPVTILANPDGLALRDFFVDLSSPDQATLNRARGRGVIVDSEQTLVFVETQKNGVNVDGMSDPASVAVASPDGAHVYVASRTADELVVFERAADTGRLSVVETINVEPFLASLGRTIDGINGFADLRLSPDGSQVYAVAQANNAIVTFVRDDDDTSPDFGRLSVAQVLFNGDQPEPTLAPPISGLLGPRSLAVSADGSNLYVAAGGAPGHVVVFSRDALSGELLFRQHLERGANDPLGTPVQGIGNASAVLVSPDNARVYVAGQADDAIAVFNRNLGDNGRLAFRNHVVDGLGGVEGIQAPSSLAIAPAGQHLYATGRDSNSLAVFNRQSNGNLSFLERLTAGVDGVEGLEEPLRLALSPDGEQVYVVSGSDGTELEPGTLAVFKRQTEPAASDFGRLSYGEVKRNKVGGVVGLWGASGVAVSPDNTHIYVAARFDQSVTVFARDLLAPVNPTVESTSHPIGAWSNNPVIDMRWSGAEDLDPSGTGSGSGLQGYSVRFSLSSLAEPDFDIDVVHSSDPHMTSSQVLPDSISHWFALRTCDNADNCSEPVTVGPYWIDATAPTGPFNLASSTHVPGEPAIPDNIISVSWDSAIDSGDAVSGLAGYSYVFNQSPDAGPNVLLNLSAGATTVDSEVLIDGLWYFHIRPIDVAGNAGAPVTVGPFAVGDDVSLPRVFGVSAVAAPDGNALVEASVMETTTTRLLVRFDKPMSASAGELANYRLYDATIAPDFVDCTTSDAGLLASVEYIGSDRLAVLTVASTLGLAAGDYTLAACPELTDFNGNGLDGNGDGTAGGVFSLRFSVAWDNLLPNPNFDQALGFASWSVNEPDWMAHDDQTDAGQAARSGSVRITPDIGSPTAFAVTRCVTLNSAASRGYAVRSRVQISDPLGDPDPVEATTSMSFYTGADCTGLIQSFISNPIVDDTGGGWQPMSASISPGAVSGAGSALVSLSLNFPGGAAFPLDAWFDNAQFFAFGEEQLPTDPPQVQEVYSSHATEFGVLSSGLATEAAITQVIVEFSRGVYTVPGGTDAEAANNAANYRLFALSEASAPSPADCSAATDVVISSVAYQAAQKRAVLRLAGVNALPEGHYRLAACGNIRDFDNNFLDGQANGTQGSDYLLDFEVGSTNLLANPNLDSTLGQWSTEVNTTVGNLRWSAADRDGLLSSGAVRVQHESGTGASYSISQCVDLAGLTSNYALGADVLTSQAFGQAPSVLARARFHAAADCDSSVLGEMEVIDDFPHSAGVWQPMLVRLSEVPAGAVSARVEFVVTSDIGSEAPFDLWLDVLKLRSGVVDLIFRNRFTSDF
jgi:large repetitive protein